MSIGPVQSYVPVVDPASANEAAPGPRPKAQPRTPAARSTESRPLPGAGRVPEQEAPVLKHAAPEPQLPEDEVKLQRDSELQNELIVRYVDGSGDLILQVPAEQVLRFKRAIAAEFERASKRTDGEAG